MIHWSFKLISFIVVFGSFIGWLSHAKGKAGTPSSGPIEQQPVSGVVALVHLLPAIYILFN